MRSFRVHIRKPDTRTLGRAAQPTDERRTAAPAPAPRGGHQRGTRAHKTRAVSGNGQRERTDAHNTNNTPITMHQ